MASLKKFGGRWVVRPPEGEVRDFGDYKAAEEFLRSFRRQPAPPPEPKAKPKAKAKAAPKSAPRKSGSAFLSRKKKD